MKESAKYQQSGISILMLPYILSWLLAGCGQESETDSGEGSRDAPIIEPAPNPNAELENTPSVDPSDNQTAAPTTAKTNHDEVATDDDIVVITEEEQEQAIKEFIASFTPEELEAKPAGVSLRDWVIPIMMHRESAAENGEVEFYGKIVDQDGDPLQGVNLHVRVARREESLLRAMEAQRQNSDIELELTTDENGRFEITDVRGYRVVLSLFRLDGYVLEEDQMLAYNFAAEWVRAHYGPRVDPDPDNPVIFTMKQKAD